MHKLLVKDFAIHCSKSKICSKFFRNYFIFIFCFKDGINGIEIPLKVKLVEEIWLPDTGLVTDSFKLKRKAIENYYNVDLKTLYK